MDLDGAGTLIGDWIPDVDHLYLPQILDLELSPQGLVVGGDYSRIALQGAVYPGYLSVIPAVPTAPAAPTAVAAIAGDGAATISWTVPSTGGRAITRVDVALDDTASSFYTAHTSASSAQITGLTNGTTYRVYVRVANDIGDSEWSSPGVSVTPVASSSGGGGSGGGGGGGGSGGGETTPVPPGAPTQVTGTPGNAQVTLSWSAPADSGSSAVTSYRVLSGPGQEQCRTSTTSCVVTGLKNGTAYTFTVAASNVAGWGPPSTPSLPVTPRTVPTPPQVTGVRAGIGEAVISWQAPSDDGGSPISGYQVTTAPGSQGCRTVQALTCTIDGLRNGTKYVVSVTAFNAAGASLPSAQVSLTPKGRPSITITGKRSSPTGATVTIRGQVKGLDVDRVRIYLRTSQSKEFRLARIAPRVDSDGSFTWTRRFAKGLVIYAVGGGERSNRVTIGPR